MVIAADHPLIGRRAAGDACDHVAQRLQAPIEFHLQMHACRAGAHVIRDAQAAAPFGRRDLAADRREQWLGIAV